MAENHQGRCNPASGMAVERILFKHLGMVKNMQ
jgi:hypothetical protein